MLVLLATLTTAHAGGPLDGCLREDIKATSSRLNCGSHMVLRDGPIPGEPAAALKALAKGTGLEITADADTAILNGIETKLAVGKRDGQAVSLIIAEKIDGGVLITNCLTLDGTTDASRCKQLLDAIATIGFPTAESMTGSTIKVAGQAVRIPPGCNTTFAAEEGTVECVDGGLLRWQITGGAHEADQEARVYGELETGLRSAFPEGTPFTSTSAPCEILGTAATCRALNVGDGQLRAWFGWATVGEQGALVTCATSDPKAKKVGVCKDALEMK